MEPVNLDISFTLFITAPGIVVAAGLVRQFVQIIKTTFPAIDLKVSGALQSFIVSAVLYILVAITTTVAGTTPDHFLVVFSAWLAVASGAIGIDSAVRHVATKDAKNFSINGSVPPDPEL